MGSMYVRRMETCNQLREVMREMQCSKMPAEWREGGFVVEDFFAGDEVDVDGWAHNGTIGELFFLLS